MPFPTDIPLIVRAQFCAPVLLLTLQKLKLVTESEYPDATSKVKVIVGVPDELLRDNDAPELPLKPPNAVALVVHEEFERFEFKVVGVSVYGLVVIEVVPKS